MCELVTGKKLIFFICLCLLHSSLFSGLSHWIEGFVAWRIVFLSGWRCGMQFNDMTQVCTSPVGDGWVSYSWGRISRELNGTGCFRMMKSCYVFIKGLKDNIYSVMKRWDSVYICRGPFSFRHSGQLYLHLWAKPSIYVACLFIIILIWKMWST